MRNGKIARLPASVRNELNRRMEREEPGATILEWLNGLAVVQTIMKEEFGGVPISKQNLHEWRQGGFREWEMAEDMTSRALAANGMNGRIDVPTLIGDLLAMIAGRYAKIMLRWDGELDPEFEAKARILGRLQGNFIKIQRSIPPAVTAGERKKVTAKTRAGRGEEGLMEQLQALAGDLAEKPRKSGEVETSKTNSPNDRDPHVTHLREDAPARQAGKNPENEASKVVELNGLGLARSVLVKPGQTGSNQKIDFSAAEARVYAQRVSS